MKFKFTKIFQRCYWGIFIGLSAYTCLQAIINLWITWLTSSLAFTVDTLYLHWNTSFPAISVCEIFNGEKNYDLNERLYGENRDIILDDLTASISFFSGSCYNCKPCLNTDLCPKNFTEMLNNYRANCSSMISNCFWNDEEFDCCDGFLELETEFGICYTINSAHTSPPFAKKLLSNRLSGVGKLRFQLFEDSQLHLHSSYDIPYINEEKYLKETILWGSVKEILFGVIEMVNNEDVKYVSISQRRCRFPFELQKDNGIHNLHYFEYYSYSTCMVTCHSEIQMKFCNCTHHLMPTNKNGKSVLCDYQGLVCLTDNYDIIVTERNECKCMDSCEEPDFNIIFSSNEEYREEPGSEITIGMLELPKQRYIRTVVRSDLDLTISVGGIAGLHYGASILSLIDLIYNGQKLLIRHFIKRKNFYKKLIK